MVCMCVFAWYRMWRLALAVWLPDGVCVWPCQEWASTGSALLPLHHGAPPLRPVPHDPQQPGKWRLGSASMHPPMGTLTGHLVPAGLVWQPWASKLTVCWQVKGVYYSHALCWYVHHSWRFKHVKTVQLWKTTAKILVSHISQYVGIHLCKISFFFCLTAMVAAGVESQTMFSKSVSYLIDSLCSSFHPSICCSARLFKG